jgi:hypothetical protein
MSIHTLPDKKINELIEKYIEKSTRYKLCVNEETDRTEQMLIELNNELKNREEFRMLMNKSKNPKFKMDESKIQNDLKK